VRRGYAVAHAWVTLDGVHAVDQTWPQPGLGYFGIVISIKGVAVIFSKRGYFGAVLDEYPESWMELEQFRNAQIIPPGSADSEG
jgi:hypothetical protein